MRTRLSDRARLSINSNLVHSAATVRGVHSDNASIRLRCPFRFPAPLRFGTPPRHATRLTPDPRSPMKIEDRLIRRQHHTAVGFITDPAYLRIVQVIRRPRRSRPDFHRHHCIPPLPSKRRDDAPGPLDSRMAIPTPLCTTGVRTLQDYLIRASLATLIQCISCRATACAGAGIHCSWIALPAYARWSRGFGVALVLVSPLS